MMTSNVVYQRQYEAKASVLESICSIRLGFDNTISRWKPGSTLKFNVDHESFPQPSYAEHASICLEEAAHLWNEGKVGVHFEKVENHERATFRLVYEHWRGPTAAKAFLPSEMEHEQPRLIVCALAFSRRNDYYENLTNVFCHELGHVLGLRHEFKESVASVLWGQANSLSVMNYFWDPSRYKIDDKDLEEVREFYAYKGTHWEGFRIVDVDSVDFDPSS